MKRKLLSVVIALGLLSGVAQATVVTINGSNMTGKALCQMLFSKDKTCVPVFNLSESKTLSVHFAGVQPVSDGPLKVVVYAMPQLKAGHQVSVAYQGKTLFNGLGETWQGLNCTLSNCSEA